MTYDTDYEYFFQLEDPDTPDRTGYAIYQYPDSGNEGFYEWQYVTAGVVDDYGPAVDGVVPALVGAIEDWSKSDFVDVDRAAVQDLGNKIRQAIKDMT